ncbi:MAG: hypothetical protein MOGMAGMI_02003 [Candidatus Omnitrophica bacterium]|nr:hypothetical protein [Candidatus Omnitrophota bacterium]
MSNDVWLTRQRAARGWIVAPTYPLAMEMWRYVHHILKDVIVKSYRSDKRVTLIKGHELEFKSADNKDANLRGAGLDFAIVDEAARVHREAWQEGIRPALADRQGRGLFISTPKGSNWFRDLYLLGQDPKIPDFASWKLPSNSSPIFPAAEWDTLRRTLPEMVFRQEFMAEFLEDASSVFRNIQKCVAGDFEDPVMGHQYVVGADIAKTTDFTVLFVLDVTTKHFVYFERFQNLDWTLIKKKIQALSNRYNKALVSLDSTGVGDPVEDDLERMGVKVQGFKFTNISKKELVELGIITLEQRYVTYPFIQEFMSEMQAFEYEILPTGKIRYRAPEGLHDDCVMAFCLALWPIRERLFATAKREAHEPPKQLDDRSYEFWLRHQKAKKASTRPMGEPSGSDVVADL